MICRGLSSGLLTGQTILTPATATPETFELYKKYQVSVHKDKPSQVSMRGFSRFLCDSPISVSLFSSYSEWPNPKAESANTI